MQLKINSTYFQKIIAAFIISFFVFGTFAEAQTRRPKNKKTKQAIEQANDKITYAPDADLLKEMRVQIKIVESKKDWKRFDRQRPMVNKRGDFSAYIAQFAIEENDDALIDVIVVYEKSKDKFYEIRGFDFPRPFDRLKWKNDDVLEFEQWVNPHNGGRYAVNLTTGKIVSAGYVRSN